MAHSVGHWRGRPGHACPLGATWPWLTSLQPLSRCFCLENFVPKCVMAAASSLSRLCLEKPSGPFLFSTSFYFSLWHVRLPDISVRWVFPTRRACGWGDLVVVIRVYLVRGLQGAPVDMSARNGWSHLARHQKWVDVASLGLGTCRGRSVRWVRGSAQLCHVKTDKVQWTFKKCVYSVVILKWFCFLIRLWRLFSFTWELHYEF